MLTNFLLVPLWDAVHLMRKKPFVKDGYWSPFDPFTTLPRYDKDFEPMDLVMVYFSVSTYHSMKTNATYISFNLYGAVRLAPAQ